MESKTSANYFTRFRILYPEIPLVWMWPPNGKTAKAAQGENEFASQWHNNFSWEIQNLDHMVVNRSAIPV
jgi:hypothetical protein